jgi:hypothetical protein
VPKAFHARARDLRTVVRVLNDYLRDADVDAPGSLAAAEHGQEAEYADDDVKDPVFHVQARAHHGLIAAIDHLGGVAACIEAENVALATMSLLRPTIVAAGLTYWVLDPNIALRERLRRGWSLELDSVREQMNSVDKERDSAFWTELTVTRYRYLRWAEAHGFEKRSTKERFGERRYWLIDTDSDKAPPSEISMAEAVLAAVGDGRVGRQAYRFISAFVHAQPHAFTSFLPAPLQWDAETPGVVPLGIRIEDLTTWLMVVTLAVHTTAARCGHYFAWDLNRWVSTVHPILAAWAGDLT